MQQRPCFLVIDREYSGSISTRKLVIETAKFNVLTAYSAQESLGLIERFPAIDGVVLDAAIGGIGCNLLVAQLKQRYPKLPVVVVAAPGTNDCPQADFQLENFDPRRLLELLQKLVPQQAAEIEARNEELGRESHQEEVKKDHPTEIEE